MLVGPKFDRILDGKPKRKKNITGKIHYEPLREKARRVCAYSSEVMVRITSFGKDPGHAFANMGYISRTTDPEKEDLELETDRGEILSGIDEIREYARGWQQDFGKANARRRDTMRMICSMPEGTNAEAVRNATRDFAYKTFAANHEYVFVLHTDEPHPHCHLTVKMLGRNGTRLNPGREDLASWREEFAQALREHGVDAIATRRAARGVVRKAEKSVVRHIENHPRKGKQRVPKVVALRELDAVAALVAEQQGRPLPPRPWEDAIRAEQATVRSAWLAAADQLEKGAPAPVLLPADHHAKVRSAQAQASAYQVKLAMPRAVDPRKAPLISSMKTVASIPTRAQIGVAGTGQRPGALPSPVILLPEDHQARAGRAQEHGATYQARLAAPRPGEPSRPVTNLAALPRLKPARGGMPVRLIERRPLKMATTASLATVASLNAPRPGAGPARIPPPLTFTQEIDHGPDPTQYAAAVYQSHLATPRRGPSQSVPSVRDLPRLNVVHHAERGRSERAALLLQQDARHYLGQQAATDPAVRRPGPGLDGDRPAGGREGGTQGREGGRPGGARSGPQDRSEVATYRHVGRVDRILTLPAAIGMDASDKALAREIRAFVAAMPAIETARDVLKRELAARFPAKPVEQAPAQEASAQEKGADQAAPKGKGPAR